MALSELNLLVVDQCERVWCQRGFFCLKPLPLPKPAFSIFSGGGGGQSFIGMVLKCWSIFCYQQAAKGSKAKRKSKSRPVISDDETEESGKVIM